MKMYFQDNDMHCEGLDGHEDQKVAEYTKEEIQPHALKSASKIQPLQQGQLFSRS